MIVMLNEKFRENVPAWNGFEAVPDLMPIFFSKLFAMPLAGLKMHEQVAFLVFLIHAFQSLENEAVSRQVLRLVQLPLWHSLSPGRLQVGDQNCKSADCNNFGPHRACCGMSFKAASRPFNDAVGRLCGHE